MLMSRCQDVDCSTLSIQAYAQAGLGWAWLAALLMWL